LNSLETSSLTKWIITSVSQAEPTPHCANIDCERLWNPGSEEQWYCWKCDLWFHTACLEEHVVSKQEEYMVMMAEKYLQSPDTSEIPQAIVEVAPQPTAHGGSLHFAAGNMQSIKFAHGLCKSEAQNELIANHGCSFTRGWG